MQELDDIALLAQFARDNSEEAFAALARRHVNLVYSVALRKTSNPAAAEEITQAVFIILARKARGFSKRTVFSGWLHQTTRLTAANYLRGEIRRQKREQEAYMQSLLNEHEPEAWSQIAPFLDDALAELAARDRDAIVLRFFENKSLRDVGGALGASEDAAKMRVNRALEKLRRIFTRRGVKLSAAVLAGAVAANSVQAAPAALTVSVAGIAQGTTATASILTLVNGALKIMAWTKAKMVIASGAVALLFIGTATVGIIAVEKLRAEALEVYFADFQSQDLGAAPSVLILRPSKYAGQGDWISSGGEPGPDVKVMRRGCPFTEVLSTAYGIGPEQIVSPAKMPRGEFDLMITLPDHRREALKAQIKKQFGLVAHTEMRDTDVLILKVVKEGASGLKTNDRGEMIIEENADSLKLTGYVMSDPAGQDVVHALSYYFHMPVIDETGLTNTYDLNLEWNAKLRGAARLDDMKKAMREQLGLDVFPDRRPIEKLIVEKVK